MPELLILQLYSSCATPKNPTWSNSLPAATKTRKQPNKYIYLMLFKHTHTHTQGTDWIVPVCPATPTAPGQIHDHLEPQNGILFATVVLADVIKHLQMESSRLKVRPKSTVLPWGLRWSRIRLELKSWCGQGGSRENCFLAFFNFLRPSAFLGSSKMYGKTHYNTVK